MQGTFAKARTVREHFRAMREKMQFEAAAGRLVSRAEVEVAAHEIGVTFREHMTQAIDAISYRIADQFGVNRYEVRSVVTDEMTQALRRLAVNIRGNEWGFETGMVQAAGATDQTNGADNDQLTDTN
jgi:isopentenyldiphosphate isomerase